MPIVRCGSLAGLLLMATLAQAVDGSWFDRERSGRGLDLHRAGDVVFGALYNYDTDGEPEWLWLQDTQAGPGTLQGRLQRYLRVDGRLQPMPAGHYLLEEAASCDDGRPRAGAVRLLRFEFELDGRAERWCLEPLLPDSVTPAQLLDGAWHDPAEPGWGLFSRSWTDAQGLDQVFRTLYFHDAAGWPRWSFSQGRLDAWEGEEGFFLPRVECADCAPVDPLQRRAGSARLALRSPLPGAHGNRIDLDLQLPGGQGFRREAGLELLSAPRRVPAAAAPVEGPVRGEIADGVERFLALPYAAPPTDALRWRPARPAALRARLLQATGPGRACMQPPGQGFHAPTLPETSEDCLLLNIWRPADPGPHPVLLWIHGGGLLNGSAMQQSPIGLTYDGSALARLGVVVVSVNYRLGPFGYLSHPALLDDADAPVANLGLLDQIQALSWVRDNIAAFGGDPARVTVFGESAGGMSTCALLASPLARGLFRAAIVQSGNCRQTLPDLDQALGQGERLAQALGCQQAADPAACLRGVSAEALLQASAASLNLGLGTTGEVYGLAMDGRVLPRAPGPAIRAGDAAPVPLLIGVTSEEQSTLTPAASLPQDAAGYRNVLQQLFGPISNLVLARYPASTPGGPPRAMQDLLADLRFVCPARRAAADHASRGHPSWHYVLTQGLPELPDLGAFHGVDVVLLFGPRPAAGPAERALAIAMQSDWVDFAHGQPPASGRGVDWPRQDARRLSLEYAGAASTVLEDWRGELCTFWNTFLDP